MKVFFRLIHISDLHFGDTLFPQGKLHVSPGQVISNIQQLETHDLLVLEALSNSVQWIRKNSKVSTRIIDTGDLTTFGTQPAFHLALTYLRSRHNIGGGQQIGFNDADMPIIPGNHDIWGGAPIGGLATLSKSSRAISNRFFSPPATPSFSPPNGNIFPYRVQLHNSPLIYLYGLDSNELHLAPGLQVQQGIIANGYISPQQLDDLQFLVNSEPNRPMFRIIAVHHPLAKHVYSANPIPRGKLISLDRVLVRLEKLGFFMAICGHLHNGFLDKPSPNSSIRIFAAGTSAQKVHLSNTEKKLLNHPPIFLSQMDRNLRDEAINKANEFRMYEFLLDRQSPKDLVISIHRYTYDPRMSAFDEKVLPRRIIF